jgi:hypothetical protein
MAEITTIPAELTFVAEPDESDDYAVMVRVIKIGTFVTFVPETEIVHECHDWTFTGSHEGIVVKADIQVIEDKSDNPNIYGDSVYSVTYDIRRVTVDGDETDHLYKSVKSDKVSVI